MVRPGDPNSILGHVLLLAPAQLTLEWHSSELEGKTQGEVLFSTGQGIAIRGLKEFSGLL